jgi:hypothetical protein
MGFVIIAGFGLTAQSTGQEISLRMLIQNLLALSNLEPKQPGERNSHALRRWEQSVSADMQEHQMWTACELGLSIQSLTAWQLLTSCNVPIVTSTYDLYAATAMYWKLFGCLPLAAADLIPVILTWQSPLSVLRDFFTPGSKTSQTRVLYREGCILTKDWLLGSRFSRARKQLAAIDELMTMHNFAVVGIEHGIDSGYLKAKVNRGKGHIFRLVRSSAEKRAGLTDVACDYFPRRAFEDSLVAFLTKLNIL